MTEWKWANEPQAGRLQVQETGESLLRFADTETGEHVTVFAPDNFTDVTMTVSAGGRTTTVSIDDAKHFLKGSHIAARNVWHYVTRQHATALRAGLTVHRNAFSSTPHEFELDTEPGFEEVFYLLLPEGGKGILEGQGLWPDGSDVDAAWPVRHRQLAQIPMGWHRVTALPLDADGNVPMMGYVWCYLCTSERWEKD